MSRFSYRAPDLKYFTIAGTKKKSSPFPFHLTQKKYLTDLFLIRQRLRKL